MKQKYQLIGLLCLLLSIPGLMWIYPSINTPARGVHILMTSLDQAIPFIKIFVIPYAAAILLVEFLFKAVDIVYTWLFLQNRKLTDVVKQPSSYTV